MAISLFWRRPYPFIGVEAIVAGAEAVDHLIDVAAVLDGHARAEGHGSALNIEGRLVNGGFGEDHSGIVLVPIGAALDAAGIALHQHAMAVGGLDIEHDVGLLGQRQRPPGDMADDHLAVACGWAGGGKRAAMFDDGVALLFEVGGRVEVEAFQSGGRGLVY